MNWSHKITSKIPKYSVILSPWFIEIWFKNMAFSDTSSFSRNLKRNELASSVTEEALFWHHLCNTHTHALIGPLENCPQGPWKDSAILWKVRKGIFKMETLAVWTVKSKNLTKLKFKKHLLQNSPYGCVTCGYVHCFTPNDNTPTNPTFSACDWQKCMFPMLSEQCCVNPWVHIEEENGQ